MRQHHYGDGLLSNRLHNVLPAFVTKSSIYVLNTQVQSVQNRFWVHGTAPFKGGVLANNFD